MKHFRHCMCRAAAELEEMHGEVLEMREACYRLEIALEDSEAKRCAFEPLMVTFQQRRQKNVEQKTASIFWHYMAYSTYKSSAQAESSVLAFIQASDAGGEAANGAAAAGKLISVASRGRSSALQ